ncbi:hypothetical protein Mp_2g20350 [Marchantia polymorpha subsp. ruderalis]|uniref:Ketoreductase (KR) domain-containing protein n=1 Tax=Marchantia polymorpha TaxID=3197 RepID=A0A2R6WV62_MARPO|nr:hypothetical protein MARPO_0055s0014 [Marchantia polymorpha]BBN03059.1 hypothetical protein Mp_2g20350 [Marchantia polymorpha subsp. ruderalis]|eukprot:PTQ37726.1 hypothetical protein MARPO_0055s0014 [Marchantia polymorpha]
MSMAIQACSSGLQLCRFPLGQELARGNEWKGANFPTQVLRKRRAAAGVEFLRFSSCAGFVVSQTSPGNEGLGIVITGGTSGLGFALARNFLEPKDRVVICGRDEMRLNRSHQPCTEILVFPAGLNRRAFSATPYIICVQIG